MLGIKLPARCRYYSHRLFDLHPEVRAMRRHLARRLGRQSVLEIGCGFGLNARLCQGPYLGLDPDAGAVSEARRRNPGLRFGGVEELASAREIHTVLFSLVLHETDQRAALLEQAAGLGARRVLIYDFDPRLTGLSRLRVTVLEESCIHSFWGFDPKEVLGRRGYALSEQGPIGARICWWEFVKSEE